MLRSFCIRGLIYLWRSICLLYTRLQHPYLWKTPSILLRYETKAQKDAYAKLSYSIKNLSLEEMHKTPRLLVVIPFRDKWSLTRACINSLLAQDLNGLSVLVALVDNGSLEEETRQGIEHILRLTPDPLLQFRYLRYDIPFNYSKLNNLAVKDSSDFCPTHIALLNNDVVMDDKKTLQELTLFLARNPIAASVGCTLLYPDSKIQHICITVGCKIVGAHPFKGYILDKNDPWCQEPRPVGAATAALLVVDYTLYVQVGGFDEALPSCYQDVDLALKLQSKGRINWVLPWIRAFHHETQTRSPVHSWDEVALMHERWGKTLTHNPYYSRALSRWSEQAALSLGEGSYPWEWVRK